MLALFAGHLCFSLWPALFEIRNDFANYYAPARALVLGRAPQRLYERDAFQLEVRRAGLAQLGSFVPHPPANALLLVPLAIFSPTVAKAAWTLLLVLAYAAALPVLRSLTGLSGWTLALVLLLPTSSLKNALAYGQPYPLLLLLLSLSLLLVARGRHSLGGLALAPVLALKLYSLPHVLFLSIGARWRAVAGLLVGFALITGLGVLALGAEVHTTYLTQILPRSLRGEIQDPYSPLWGSISSLTHRLFQAEPDLNPSPATDAPAFVALTTRVASAFLVLLALAARPSGEPVIALRRQWSALTLAALAASPLTQSYHFVLLPLPVALLLAERPTRVRALLVLALMTFATSPLPHYFAPLAHGWANLLAYPRLFSVVALLVLALRGLLSRASVLLCGALALAAGLFAPTAPVAPDWQKVQEARGYLAAEPLACEGGLAWVATLGDRYVVRHSDGRLLRGEGDFVAPRCVAGRLDASLLTGDRSALADGDSDRDARGLVRVAADGALLASDAGGAERVLARGRFRRPRLSPDGRLIAVASWEDGSWDIRVVDRESGASRRATSQPSNEIEPAWTADGASILFASDWRRGLGSTALYRTELR